MPATHRHPLSREENRLTDRQLALRQPPGTGVSVRSAFMFDLVIRRAERNSSTTAHEPADALRHAVPGAGPEQTEWIVTERPADGGKPVRVYGPVPARDQAEAWFDFAVGVCRAIWAQMGEGPVHDS